MQSIANASLFCNFTTYTSMYFLIYVDDIVINGGDDKDVLALIDLLRKKFALKHLGILNYFLGTKGNYFTKW